MERAATFYVANIQSCEHALRPRYNIRFFRFHCTPYFRINMLIAPSGPRAQAITLADAPKSLDAVTA